MITMTRDIALTLDDEDAFYRRECITWGKDYIDALLAEGYVIVSNGARGFTWVPPELDRSARIC